MAPRAAETETGVFALDRAKRPTKGKRVTKNQEEDNESDEEFWNQEAFQEKESDEDFAERDSDSGDSFDSDFGEDEEQDGDEEDEAAAELEDEEEKRQQQRKKQLKTGIRFVGKQQQQAPPAPVAPASPSAAYSSASPHHDLEKKQQEEQQKMQQELQERQGAAASASDAEASPVYPRQPLSLSRSRHEDVYYDDGKDSIASRRSTRSTVADINARREEERVKREWLKSSKLPQKQQQQQHKKRKQITQDKLIEDAAYTEILNQRWLEVFLQKEEASNPIQDTAGKRRKVEGPSVGYRSNFKRGTYYSVRFPSLLVHKPHQRERRSREMSKPVCVVTGKAARYRDPKTGNAFADVESFKALRKQARAEERERAREKRKQLGNQPAEAMNEQECWQSKKQRIKRRVARSNPGALLFERIVPATEVVGEKD